MRVSLANNEKNGVVELPLGGGGMCNIDYGWEGEERESSAALGSKW
jgi:hypothetical protein